MTRTCVRQSRWHHVIEPKLVKKARLVSILSPHHRQILLIQFDQESSFSDSLKYFFDSIDPLQKCSN
jgi:hypothetical protein